MKERCLKDRCAIGIAFVRVHYIKLKFEVDDFEFLFFLFFQQNAVKYETDKKYISSLFKIARNRLCYHRRQILLKVNAVTGI